MLRIVADENIPYVQEAFGSLGTVALHSGTAITRAHIQAADVLLVRSITRVDEALVSGSNLKFVGSATIGTDHVHQEYLTAAGIPFYHAPGCNAESVVEYVLAALLTLSERRGEPLRGKTVGIVGCGNIGSRLADRLPSFGVEVLLNDPPLARKAGADSRYVTLDRVLEASDVISLHVPLIREGQDRTVGLITAAELARMKPTAWLINSCRGAVVDNRALCDALRVGQLSTAVLDVWEGEPEPDPDLVRRVDLATPHIAGYSFDGKVNGTIMLYDALTRELGLDPKWNPQTALEWSKDDHPYLTPPNDRVDPLEPAYSEVAWLHALAQQMYDIQVDDIRMRTMLALPRSAHARHFHDLRKHYPRRRTWTRHILSRFGLPDRFTEQVRTGMAVSVMTQEEPLLETHVQA